MLGGESWLFVAGGVGSNGKLIKRVYFIGGRFMGAFS